MNDKTKKPPNVRVLVRNGRLSYADTLIVAKPFEPGAPEKFGCSIVMAPDKPAIEQIEAAIEAAVFAKWGSKSERPARLRGLNYDPVVKICSEYPRMGKFPPGYCFVRAGSSDAPGIVGPDVKEIDKPDLRKEVYSGRWANVSVTAFTYERKTGNGVSLGVNNVQLLKHDERLGAARPSATEEFDSEDLPAAAAADNDDLDNDDDLQPARRPSRRR